VLLGILNRLANRIGRLPRLPDAEAHMPPAVADDDRGSRAWDTPALYGLARAIHSYNPVFKLHA